MNEIPWPCQEGPLPSGDFHQWDASHCRHWLLLCVYYSSHKYCSVSTAILHFPAPPLTCHLFDFAAVHPSHSFGFLDTYFSSLTNSSSKNIYCENSSPNGCMEMLLRRTDSVQQQHSTAWMPTPTTMREERLLPTISGLSTSHEHAIISSCACSRNNLTWTSSRS